MRSRFLEVPFPEGHSSFSSPGNFPGSMPSRTVVHTKPEDGSASDSEDVEADAAVNDAAENGSVSIPIPPSTGKTGTPLPYEIQSQLQSSVGTPMSPSLQSSMETALQRDFSKVKLHSDAPAIQANRYLSSSAFALGNDVYFNQGAFNPSLLMHELVHVAKSDQEGKEPGYRQDMTLDEKLKAGLILSNDEIRKLDTRRQRAEYLFTAPKNQEGRGHYIYKGEKAVDAAVSGKRIYAKESDAKSDMVSLKLDVFGDGRTTFTLTMNVHYKLADYVKAIFKEIKEAYSNEDPSDNFVFDINDGARGAYHWRYSRYDQAEFPEKIAALEDKINSMELDEEELRAAMETAAQEKAKGVKKEGKDTNLRKLLYSNLLTKYNAVSNAISKYERIIELDGMSDADDASMERFVLFNEINSLGLSEDDLKEAESIAAMSTKGKDAIKAKKKKKDTFLKRFVEEHNKRVNKIDAAVLDYKSIAEYENTIANLNQKTKDLDDKNASLEDQINGLKLTRDEKEKEKEQLEYQIKIIEGILKGKKVSDSTQEEFDKLKNEHTDDFVFCMIAIPLMEKISENEKKLEVYLKVQELRKDNPYIDVVQRKKFLEKSVADRLSSHASDEEKKARQEAEFELNALRKSPGDLNSEIKQLKLEIDDDSKELSSMDLDNIQPVKEKRLEELRKKKEEQLSLEESYGNNKKTLNKTLSGLKSKLGKLGLKKVDQDILSLARQIENNEIQKPGYKSDQFSEHSAGIAIDINPETNPFYDSFENAPNLFREGEIDKEENLKYYPKLKEDKLQKWHDKHLDKDRYVLKADSKIVQIFKKYGWNWGGDWSKRDYMHFEWFSKTWPKN